MLEVRDLELVLALIASGTTAAAASALNITQSAVSRALAQAEQRVGMMLFERTARGLTPTLAGQRLAEGARLVLAQLYELERQLAAPAAVPTRLRLVCECYTAYRWLPSAVAALRSRLPHLSVDLRVEHTNEPAAALVRGDIDVALLTGAPLSAVRAAPAAIVERPLFSDEIVFVLSSAHPLAQRRSLTPDDLRENRLITATVPASEARWFSTRVFGRRRPKLDVIRFPLTEAAIDAARAQLGIAVLSEWVANGYLTGDDLVVKRLASGPLRRPWRIAYRRDLADAVELLASGLESSRPRLYLRAR